MKLHNCGCSYCVATGCSQDRKEAQQQQQQQQAVWGGGWLVNCYSKNNRENGKNTKLEKQKQKSTGVNYLEVYQVAHYENNDIKSEFKSKKRILLRI